MTTHKNLLTLCVAAVLTLGLAACGGDGGDDPVTTMPDPTPPPDPQPDPAIMERQAISDAIAEAMTAVAAVNDESTDEEVTAAEMAVADAMTAIADAANVPEAEKAANSGTVAALHAQLTSAKDSRQMAMDAAAAAQRMANISAAQAVLTSAQNALEALADDATDQQKLDAQRMIEAAANALRDVLQMNGGSTSEIEAAIRTAQTAKVAADALQATITAAAEAEAARQMAAINAAQMALSNAEDALAELGEDATDKEVRDAHREIENAADDLITVLENNGGTADQIAAATMTRDSAKMMADALTSPIDIADQRQAITDALAVVRTTVAAVDDDATDAQVKAADDAIAAARKAIEDATDLPDAETSANTDTVNAYAGILDTAKTSRMAALDAKAAEEAAEAREASNKVALTKKTAIETEGDSTTTLARPFDLATPPTDPDNPTAEENYVVTVKHTGSAVEVEVADGALPADNDPMYAQTETFGNGRMLVRNIGTHRKIIVLHTDIEAPDQVAFSSEYSLTVDRDTDTTANDTYAVLAGDNDKIASSSFPSGDNTSKTFVVYAADTPTGRASQFSGTFDGASGLYRCVAGGGCTVATNAMGDFAALTAGEWEFTPAAGATVSKPDDDYMTYGFWLDTTTKDGDITSYDTVQTFATSSLTASTGLASVTGTATYEGDAAGVYVHESKNEDGTLDTATSGRFTADVALKAYFEAVTPFAADTIQGTISNFDLDGGPANSWNVDLTATGIDTDAGFTGNASGGVTGQDGSLSGRFHGAGDAATDAPPVLVGEFNSTFVNGTAAGAFGARTDD